MPVLFLSIGKNAVKKRSAFAVQVLREISFFLPLVIGLYIMEFRNYAIKSRLKAFLYVKKTVNERAIRDSKDSSRL